jgi:hypothetical protein
MSHRIVFSACALALALSTAAFFGCSDSSSSTNGTNNAFNPGGSSTSPDGGSSNTADTSGDGGACSKPANCFCGTPTTQQQWLNRCTQSAALPVTLTVKAATTADIP